MNAIAFPWFERIVAITPECMGYRSIIAMSLLAAFCAYANRLTFTRATVLLAGAVAISIVGNVSRMLLILTVAAFAPDFGFGLWHDLCGYVVFVVAVLAMASVASKLALSEQHLIDGKTGGK